MRRRCLAGEFGVVGERLKTRSCWLLACSFAAILALNKKDVARSVLRFSIGQA